MKKIFSFALMACALLLNTACSDENVESRTPVASIQYDTNKTTLKVNESLVIDFTGVADLVAIYPGDDGHRYEKRDEMETGIAVNKNHFTYSYKAPGTYHVVCVASTFDTYMGGNLKQATCSFDVTVVDDETEFKDLYTTITPNTFYANKLGDDAWVLNLPTNQVYNGKDITVTFLVEGNEVASGTTTNLDGKTLTLERSAATNAQAKAVSNIEFVFKYQ